VHGCHRLATARCSGETQLRLGASSSRKLGRRSSKIVQTVLTLCPQSVRTDDLFGTFARKIQTRRGDMRSFVYQRIAFLGLLMSLQEAARV
jgi:hypothetical protein